MNTQDQIAVVIKQSGLEKPMVNNLMADYSKYFSEAKAIVSECKDIQVTSEDQVDLMQKAREARLKLKNIRVEADKTRAKLKAQSMREGNAIQGIYNVIKALIVPVEEHLEKQEKFAEVQEQLRVEKRLTDRTEKLSRYVPDVSLYSIKDMDDEVFNNLLSGCKLSWDKAKEAEAEAEAKRIADEKAEVERQEKIRLENEKLKKEAEVKEKALEIERQKQAEQLNKEREAKEKAEDKLKAEKAETLRKETEKKAIEELKEKEAEEVERKKLLAPDKEKLLSFATELSLIKAPAVKSREADQVMAKATKQIENIVFYLQEEAKKL